MTQRIIKATEPHIKQRYGFVASAFVRMWGRSSLNDCRIVEFCEMWAHGMEDAPLDNNVVDQYFYYEFKTWRGY